jgi:polyhydroxyalkanoate synthesis regulator phasin
MLIYNKMGVDYEKCDSCKECLVTDMFSYCFCCENSINGLCKYCVPEMNCVDEDRHLCDNCLQNATDEEIKSGADNYHIKNISKILKGVKKIRKKCFSKEVINKRLQEEINECNNEIEILQNRIIKLQNKINKNI